MVLLVCQGVRQTQKSVYRNQFTEFAIVWRYHLLLAQLKSMVVEFNLDFRKFSKFIYVYHTH